jgi:hypothetical protein
MDKVELKELRYSYSVFTMLQVVVWPLDEVALGPRGNFCPCLINIVTEGLVLHMYGPETVQTLPVVPIGASTGGCDWISTIVISP